MNDLQLGLLAIGAVVVVGVLAYNKWQEMRFRHETDGHLKSGHEDVLMGGHQDPSGAAAAPQRAQTASDAERQEPTFSAPDAAAAPVTAVSAPPRLSEAMDHIVTVEAAEEIDGRDMLDASAVALAGFSKTVRFEGYAADAARWEPLRAEGRYALMRAGLQLVDRRGRVSGEDLTLFGAAVKQAAAGAGALASVPDGDEATARAKELDDFCGNVDILIAVHVVASAAPFAGTKVRALAEAGGLVMEDDGRFRRRDEEGRILYELSSLDATPFGPDTMRIASVPGLTLELDVPRTPEPVRAFVQFGELARRLAQYLEGSIVDEKRAPISPAAFEQILAQIRTVERAMTERSVPPGSPEALRLFS